MLLLTSPFTCTVLPLYLEELLSRSPIGMVEAQPATRRTSASGERRRTARDEPSMMDGSGTGSEACREEGTYLGSAFRAATGVTLLRPAISGSPPPRSVRYGRPPGCFRPLAGRCRSRRT